MYSGYSSAMAVQTSWCGGIDAIRRFMLLLPIVGYLIITGNYFQFTGRPKISLALTIIRQVGFLIPALLILPDYFGLNGVWYAMPTSDAGAFLITTFFFFRELKSGPAYR